MLSGFVYRIDNEGGGFMKLYKKLSALLITALLITTTPIMATDYANHWAKAAIDKWVNKGIITGFDDGTFRPNEALTKAQFAKILVDLLGYTSTTDAVTYQDVKENAWYRDYIDKISSAKIMYIAGDHFYPNAPITREEAAYALMNAFHLKADAIGKNITFTDQAQISSWAKDAVSTLSLLEYFSGMSDGTFNPKGQLTRAEFVVLLERLDLAKKINASTPITPTPTTPHITEQETHQTIHDIPPSYPNSDNDSSTSTPQQKAVLLGGRVLLADANGNSVRFPKSFKIQLNLCLYNGKIVLSTSSFNFEDYKYSVYESDDLVTGQTYKIEATLIDETNHNNVYYLEETITWPSELVAKDLILKLDGTSTTTPDDTTPPDHSTPTIPDDTTPPDHSASTIPDDTTPPDDTPTTLPDHSNNDTSTENTLTTFENQVLDLVNEERAKVGAPPLAMSEELRNIARLKSTDMYTNQYFDHTSPTYGSPFDMLAQFGVSYAAAGENIANGQTSPEQVMNSWMNSPGHRANILNANFTTIGVGYNAEGRFWTQIFTG